MGQTLIQLRNIHLDIKFYLSYTHNFDITYKDIVFSLFRYPGLRLLLFLRICVITYHFIPITSIPFVWLTRFLYKVDFGPQCELGPEIYFPHPFNIVIGGRCRIAGKCSIFDGVSIGKKYPGRDNPMPKIGFNCKLYSGAKILGDVILEGNNSIGANSVCTVSLKKNYSCVGYNKIIKN